MEFQYEYAGKSYPVHVKKEGDVYKMGIGENEHEVTMKELKPGYYLLRIDGRHVKVCMATEGDQRHIFLDGAVYRFTKMGGRKRKEQEFEGLSPEISSPISGKVVMVDVEEGVAVKEGQSLMAIEAMKMEYQIKAPFDGTVKSVRFSKDEQVEIGEVLIEMEKEE